MPKETCPDLQLQSDEPIANEDADSLERKNLAESIASRILSRDKSACMVVGISGPWGSGKTSLLNLVHGQLHDEADKKKGILLLRFNPWSYFSIDQIIAAFFRDLRSTLSLIDKKELVGKIGDALEKLAVALIPLSMVPSLQPAATVSLVISPIAKMMMNAAKSKPLADIKKDLNGYLQEAGVHLIILIDDLDRAEPECVRLMLQLIRMNADFSNTTYVLAFDRDRTARALSTAVGGTDEDGLDYLGKMIQVPFDLPILEALRLQVEVVQAADPFFEIVDKDVDQMRRLREVIDAGFYELFDNVRDAKRFANALAVTLPLVWDEVNPVDFAVLEALRLRCPTLHAQLHKNRWLLLSEPRSLEESLRELLCDYEPDREAHKKAHCSLLDHVTRGERAGAETLLKTLFPQLARLSDSSSSWDQPIDTRWGRERLICSGDHFDSYFFLSPGMRSVSEQELNTALSLTDDREALGKKLLDLDKEGKAEQMLQRFSMRAEDLSPTQIEVAIRALLDVGDHFSGRGQRDPDPESALRMSHSLSMLTRAIDDRVVLKGVLERSIESGRGIYSVARFTDSVVDITFYGVSVLSDEDQGKLKQLACQRIRRAAEEGELLQAPWSVFILFHWKEWEKDPTRPGSFIKEKVQTDFGLLEVVEAFVRTVRSYSSVSGDVEITHEFPLDELRQFVAPEELTERAKNILSSGEILEACELRKLTSRERDLLRGFVDSVEAKSNHRGERVVVS